MRLEDKVKKKWKKARTRIKKDNKFNYTTITVDDFKSGLDQVMGCFIEALKEETSKLQRDEHRKSKKD